MFRLSLLALASLATPVWLFGAASASDVDLKVEYPLPEAESFVAGPIVLGHSCGGTAKCLSVMEAAPDGKSVRLAAIPSAKEGDYLFGRLDVLGLPEPKVVEQSFYLLLQQAKHEYEAQVAKPPDQQLTPEERAALEASQPEFTTLPDWYREKVIEYEHTIAAEKCSIPLTALDILRTDQSLKNDLGLGQTTTIGAMLTSAFREHCLVPIMKSKSRNLLARLVYLLDQTDDSDSVPLKCAGIIIGFDVMLTARHCMIDERGNPAPINPDSVPYKVEVVPGTRAIVLGVPGHVFKLQIEFEGFNKGLEQFHPYYDAAQDFILVKLVGLDTSIFSPIELGIPETLASLKIPAIYVPQAKAVAIIQNGTARDDVLAEFSAIAKVDESPLCVLWKLKGTCIAHACQTEPGFSGTPILIASTEGFALVGVHTGSFGTKYPACGFLRGEYVPNYGVLAPAEALKAELERLRNAN